MSYDKSRFSLLRHRDFCVFWTGSFLSSIGTQFTTVAMAWQIYELTNSALQIGLLGVARALPQIALLLVGGLLADAMNRRKLMMCTQLGLFCVSTLLALMTFAGKASPYLLYVATGFFAFFTSLLLGKVRGLFRIYARDFSFVGPKVLGFLYASSAVGSLLAAGAMALFGPVKHSGRWIFLGIAIYGVATVLFAGSQVFWFSF